MNRDDWKDVKGTVMIRPPEGMSYFEFQPIIKAVTKVTRVEGGYESSFTLSGDILFFHMTETESDELYSELSDIYGEDFVVNDLDYAYDDDFGDDEE